MQLPFQGGSLSSALAAGLTLGPSASLEAHIFLFSLLLHLAELLGWEA